MLGHRVINSALLIIFLWLLIFILPIWIFAIAVVGAVGLGLYEFFNMVSKKGIPIYRYFGIIIGCLIPITTYLQFRSSAEMEFVLITAVCFCVFLLQIARRKTEHALVGIATTFFGIFYIGWLFSFAIKLRMLPPLNMDGRFLVLYLLLVTKSGDIAAYFIGTFFGKHQLIPRISPKKSIEGAVAGCLVSFIVAIGFKSLLPDVSIIHICAIGLLISLVGQVGDLSESLIKRDCQVKDSGSLFLGLGGILDLIDSLIFTTPIFYFYLRLIT